MPCFRVLAASLIATAVMLGGCGSTPQSAPDSRPLKQRRAVAPPMQQPQAPMPGAMNQDPRALLAAVSQAEKSTQGFSATIETYDKGPKETGRQTIKVAYKKPGTLAITMVKNTSGNEGTVALWSGGNDIKVKPAFPPITVSLPLSDDRIVSQNGWTLKETEVGAIFRVLLDPAAQIRPLGPQPAAGKMVTMLEVKSQKSPKGTTHEIIGIDPQTNLPAVRSIYKGSQLVFKLEIKSIKLGVPSASAFSL